MKSFHNGFKPSRVRWWVRGALFPLCLFIAANGLAQTPRSFPENPPPPLQVSMQALFEGETLHNGAILHKPAHIFILAFVTTAVAAHAGDSVTIDFFANASKLGSGKSVWHNAIKPDPNSRKFQPMIMVDAGFGGVDFDWSNAPAGSYALTARAAGLHGLSAVSAPVNITVLASPPPQTTGQSATGTHVLTGKQRTPLKPVQVTLYHTPPHAAFEVVGIATSLAPGRMQQDRDDAVSELKNQAALM
jgi:hypothetical protein